MLDGVVRLAPPMLSQFAHLGRTVNVLARGCANDLVFCCREHNPNRSARRQASAPDLAAYHVSSKPLVRPRSLVAVRY